MNRLVTNKSGVKKTLYQHCTNRSFQILWPRKLISRATQTLSGSSCSVVRAKQMRDGNENHGAQRCCPERVKVSAAKNSQLRENPAPDVGANQGQQNIPDAAEAAAARNFSCKPSRNQTEKQP